ncbi:MAG: glycoside hydrolase family 15 protein [Spirochaetota bacterium]
MGYQPIENYGVIGDLHTVALVGTNGAIDWFCYPAFDSPSVFGAILDDERGGTFRIWADHETARQKQFYWPETNVLVTRFLCEDGVGEVIDFMPVGGITGRRGTHQLIRRVTTVRGSLQWEMRCEPAFDYGRAEHEAVPAQNGVAFQTRDLSLGLASGTPIEVIAPGSSRDDAGSASDRATPNGAAVATFTLSEGETTTFILQEVERDSGCGGSLPEPESEQLFRDTVTYWRNWISQSTYTGRWREMVHRSALILKLLTYKPTGAIVAAPTTSLPEGIGGERNWDYRFTWIRDAAFTLYALMRIGFTEEAESFMDWIQQRAHELRPDGSLQIMYGIDGRHDLTEETLPHLKGYRDSKPVRIGNGAYDQLQLDIYGELLDSVYLSNKYGSPISYDFWVQLRRLINWVADNWRKTDEGIWEVRGGRQHFVYSKLMCWVALDRGIRLADKRSFPSDRDRWIAVRDEIYEEIMEHGWSDSREAFVQAYGSEALDASNLMMPLVFFVSPTDPRMLKTLDATLKSPDEGGLVSNSLTFRYDVSQSPDGLSGEEGTFNICSFWLVEALTRAGRTDRARLDEARLMFEKMLGYANHLGLFAEETGPLGEALGNFPQAFTHLALISAAFNLDRTLG